ncbi:Uncharacterised protein [Escherichia coli]|uniref:Uncharacterized protein n=1 Tax=Escherichia coli TaxID=562 RepID=A0A377AKI1_ECOLX|nr:Uncharacterised protein [Escherichia coli]
MRISFKRATEQQRKEFLADDVAAVYDLMKEVVESGNYTAAKMLKLQFLLGDLKYKSEVVAGRPRALNRNDNEQRASAIAGAFLHPDKGEHGMPSTSTKKEMAVSDVLYALSTICDGANDEDESPL